MIDETAAPTAPLKPYLSALFRPRRTIRQVIHTTSTPAFLVLCGAIGAYQGLSFLANASIGWQDWGAVGLFVLICTLATLIGLYVTAAIVRFIGRLMGGITGRQQIRIAMAWGAVPLAWGALISALLLALKSWSGNALISTATSALLVVTGLWSFIITVAMLIEVQQLSAARAFAGYVGAIFLTFLIFALPIRVFLWQPFNIPSSGSAPTLIVGDYFFVSKYSYGFSKYSFPYGPDLFEGRIFASDPHRGDVVVFKTPSDNSTDFIKRLIGLPGDKIQMRDGLLYLNGVAVPRKRVADRIENTRCGQIPVHQYRETLAGGKSYLTQKLSETCSLYQLSGGANNTEVFVVPPGHYFMMGDNRDDSADSRYPAGEGVGYVPAENLVGRARVLFFSLDEDASWYEFWRWPAEIRWSRIGSLID